MLCIQTIKIKDLISIIQIKILKCSNISNNKCLISKYSKIHNNRSSNNNSRNHTFNSSRDSSSNLIITHNNNKTFLKIISTTITWDITITWILDNSINTSRCIIGSSTSNNNTCSSPSVLASDRVVLGAPG